MFAAKHRYLRRESHKLKSAFTSKAKQIKHVNNSYVPLISVIILRSKFLCPKVTYPKLPDETYQHLWTQFYRHSYYRYLYCSALYTYNQSYISILTLLLMGSSLLNRKNHYYHSERTDMLSGINYLPKFYLITKDQDC